MVKAHPKHPNGRVMVSILTDVAWEAPQRFYLLLTAPCSIGIITEIFAWYNLKLRHGDEWFEFGRKIDMTGCPHHFFH